MLSNPFLKSSQGISEDDVFSRYMFPDRVGLFQSPYIPVSHVASSLLLRLRFDGEAPSVACVGAPTQTGLYTAAPSRCISLCLSVSLSQCGVRVRVLDM